MTDFFIVGGIKAGTTSLHWYLAQHPEVAMSRTKWTRFFHVDGGDPDWDALARRYGRALLRESVGRFQLMCHAGVPRTIGAYLEQWPPEAGGKRRGESSPSYMYDPDACRRIQQRFPRAKVIAVLREPIARALSHFVMDRAHGWVPETDFMDAVRREPVRADSFWWGLRHYLRHGLYAAHVARLRRVFGAGQLQVMFYDDLCADPRAFMAGIVRFLGLAPYEFDLGTRHNSAPGGKPALGAEDRAALAKLYAPEIDRLERETGRDLRHWR